MNLMNKYLEIMKQANEDVTNEESDNNINNLGHSNIKLSSCDDKKTANYNHGKNPDKSDKTPFLKNAQQPKVKLSINPPEIIEWDAEMKELIKWFDVVPKPTEPFHLQDHIYVTDPEKFFDKLRREIEIGPRGPRARTCALQSDLRNLKAYFSDL